MHNLLSCVHRLSMCGMILHILQNNNFILATICTLCEAPESNTIDSAAIQINCIIIILSHFVFISCQCMG